MLEGRILLSGNPTIYTVDMTTDTGAGSGTTGDLRLLHRSGEHESQFGRQRHPVRLEPLQRTTPQSIVLATRWI